MADEALNLLRLVHSNLSCYLLQALVWNILNVRSALSAKIYHQQSFILPFI